MTRDGKRIVVLGGSSGIGLATAQAAAKEGASVVIASSRKARVDEALATLPAGTEGHALDLADETAVQALFASLGGFDHLVFTAGENPAAWQPDEHGCRGSAPVLRFALLGGCPTLRGQLGGSITRRCMRLKPDYRDPNSVFRILCGSV